MKQRIGQIGNIPLVIGDEHEVTSSEILVEQSKTDPNKIDIKRRINGKLKALTNTQGKTKVVNTKRHKIGKFIHHIRPNIKDRECYFLMIPPILFLQECLYVIQT